MNDEKRTVLIAEDNPGLARVLSFKFKSSGFVPTTCGNGGDAWKAFCEGQFDAVVSDHEMPVMSGVELFQRIREVSPDLPCFLVTGRQLELSRDPNVLALNVGEVFGKPFSPATVVAAVAVAITEHQTNNSGPAANETAANAPVPAPLSSTGPNGTFESKPGASA